MDNVGRSERASRLGVAEAQAVAELPDEMEEIVATGREVYLQAYPLRRKWPGNARKSSGKAEE